MFCCNIIKYCNCYLLKLLHNVEIVDLLEVYNYIIFICFKEKNSLKKMFFLSIFHIEHTHTQTYCIVINGSKIN